MSINNDTWECRYGIITTNGKSLYFQGVHAFAVAFHLIRWTPFFMQIRCDSMERQIFYLRGYSDGITYLKKTGML